MTAFILDIWSKARIAKNAGLGPDNSLMAYLDFPPNRNIDDIFTCGETAFAQIRDRYNVEISRDPSLPGLISVLALEEDALTGASNEIHKEIKRQADPKSNHLIQPPVDTLPRTEIRFKNVENASMVALSLSQVYANKTPQRLLDLPSRNTLDLMPEFTVDAMNILRTITHSMGTNDRGIQIAFGHLRMPKPKSLQEVYSHTEFYTLAKDLGDRGAIETLIRDQTVIRAIFSQFEEHEGSSARWYIILGLGDHEVETEIEYSTRTEISGGMSTQELAQMKISPYPAVRKKNTSATGQAVMSVACSQRFFDWAVEVVSKSTGTSGAGSESYLRLARALKLTGNVRRDDCGPYPPIFIQQGMASLPIQYVLLRCHRQIRLLSKKCYCEAILHRKWLDVDRITTRADDIGCRVTLMAEARNISSDNGKRDLLGLVEEAQGVLDGIKEDSGKFDRNAPRQNEHRSA